MTDGDALLQFGLPSAAEHRRAIRAALESELELEKHEAGLNELIRCLVAQLFSIGNVEDSLLIWRVKSTNFDLMCGIDVQFFCGAGLEKTKAYLRQTNSPESHDALKYLDECVASGDFEDWTPAKTLAFYRYYFHLDPEPPPES